MRTAFEHEGDIRGVDLLACLVTLWRETASGTLQFSRSGATAGFEIAGGELVGTSTSDPRFETAAILVRAGKLDTRTLERLAAPEGADRALLALQAGVLTRREHRWGEKIRAVEILSDLLGWLEGEYVFVRTSEPPRETTEPRLPIPRLVLELFLRSRDRSLVLKYLGGADVPLARAPSFDAEFSTFGLTADAESVVRLIDGTSSAEEIAAEAPAEAFAIEKLLAALVTLGLVHPAFAGIPPEPERPGTLAAEPRGEAETVAAPTVTAASEREEGVGEDEGPEEFELDEDEEAAADLPSTSATPMDDWRPTSSDASAEDAEGPSELGDEEPEPVPEEPAVDAPLSGRGLVAPELEFAPLGDEPRPVDEPRTEIVESLAKGADLEPPLDASPGVDEAERPRPRSSSMLIWILVLLAAVVGGILWVRGRGPSSAPFPVAAVAATPTEPAAAPGMETTMVAPPPAGVEAGPATTTAVPAAAPTAVPAGKPAAVPTRARPTPAPTRARPTAAPNRSPAPASAAGGPTSRQYWADRAARDAQKLASDRKTRYAIQLELACEVESLVDAFQHDRPSGSMWVLATPFQGRSCFKVLWGRYPSIEAARRALPGAPKFFSTAKNHPAVTGVR
jgi:hypothetical protein